MREAGCPTSRCRQYKLLSTSVVDLISAGLGGGGRGGGVTVLKHLEELGLTDRIEGVY